MKKIILMAILATPSQCIQYCIELQGGLCRFMPDPNECLTQQRICVQDCLGN